MKKNLFENFTPKKAVATVAASALGLTLFAGYVSHAFTLRNFTPIGAEKATEIALGHLNSTDGSPLIKECELDGRRYDIEIIADGVEYEYKIDAKTGSVLSQKFDKDSVITTTSAPSTAPSAAITRRRRTFWRRGWTLRAGTLPSTGPRPMWTI